MSRSQARLAVPSGSWVKDLMKQLVSGPTTTLSWRGSNLIDHLHIESEKRKKFAEIIVETMEFALFWLLLYSDWRDKA